MKTQLRFPAAVRRKIRAIGILWWRRFRGAAWRMPWAAAAGTAAAYFHWYMLGGPSESYFLLSAAVSGALFPFVFLVLVSWTRLWAHGKLRRLSLLPTQLTCGALLLYPHPLGLRWDALLSALIALTIGAYYAVSDKQGFWRARSASQSLPVAVVENVCAFLMQLPLFQGALLVDLVLAQVLLVWIHGPGEVRPDHLWIPAFIESDHGRAWLAQAVAVTLVTTVNPAFLRQAAGMLRRRYRSASLPVRSIGALLALFALAVPVVAITAKSSSRQTIIEPFEVAEPLKQQLSADQAARTLAAELKRAVRLSGSLSTGQDDKIFRKPDAPADGPELSWSLGPVSVSGGARWFSSLISPLPQRLTGAVEVMGDDVRVSAAIDGRALNGGRALTGKVADAHLLLSRIAHLAVPHLVPQRAVPALLRDVVEAGLREASLEAFALATRLHREDPRLEVPLPIGLNLLHATTLHRLFEFSAAREMLLRVRAQATAHPDIWETTAPFSKADYVFLYADMLFTSGRRDELSAFLTEQAGHAKAGREGDTAINVAYFMAHVGRFPEARALLQSAGDPDSYGPILAARWALSLYMQDKGKDADALCQRRVERSADKGSAHAWWAEVLQYAGREDAANQQLMQALSHEPDAASMLLARSEVLLEMSRYAEAEGTIKRVLSESPDEPKALALVCQLYRDTFRFESALAACRDAALANPLAPERWVELGRVYLARGDHDAAMEQARRAESLYGGLAVATTLRADVYSARDERDKAITLLEGAISSCPHDGELVVQYVRALIEAGEGSRARLAIGRFVALTAANEWYVPVLRAEVLREEGAHQASLRDYNLAIARDPFATYAIKGKAELLREMGEYGDSLAALEHLLSIDAYWPAAHALWSQTNLDQCEARGEAGEGCHALDDAVAHARKGLAMDPRCEECWQALARAREMEGAHGAAVSALEEAERAVGAKSWMPLERAKAEAAMAQPDVVTGAL